MTPETAALTTFVTAVVAGVCLVAAARRLRVPAIVLLLGGGMLLGPAGVGLVRPESLGSGLKTIINCAVAVILFEGGLSLNLQGYRDASGIIRRLLTLGAVVTWLATAAAVWLIFGFDPLFCLLAGSLVIVTGPTVIVPLLKRIRLKQNLHHILHWEGVLIDAVGVFIAVFCVEIATGRTEGGFAFAQFLMRVAIGLGVGLAVGWLVSTAMRAEWVPEEDMNLVALASALATFAICEVMSTESGLLGVVVAGFVLAVRAPRGIRAIKEFKEQMTDLLIGILFILLAAKLDVSVFSAYGWKLVLLVGCVMLVVRPLNVFLCSGRNGLEFREKLLLSWIAPRGIVAASLASLLSITLPRDQFPEAGFLEAFTYSVIIATVVLQGFSAGWVAKLLGVKRTEARGWLIVGAHRLSQEIGRIIRDVAKVDCIVVDSNARAVRETAAVVPAVRADALDPDLPARLSAHPIGRVLAVTDNEDLNVRVCAQWSEVVGKKKVYWWSPQPAAVRSDGDSMPGVAVWGSVPKPSIVSFDIESGNAAVFTSSRALAGPAVQGHIHLGTLEEGRFSLDHPPVGKSEGESPASGPVTHVYLKREQNLLELALQPGLVARFGERDFEPLVRKMVAFAAAEHPGLPAEECVTEILEREKIFPTSIGHGFAVPHGYHKGLKRRICVAAQVPEGVEMPSPDGQPVQLVFVLLSPTGDAEGHLAVMSQIAHLAVSRETTGLLSGAHGPVEFMEIIRSRQA